MGFKKDFLNNKDIWCQLKKISYVLSKAGLKFLTMVGFGNINLLRLFVRTRNWRIKAAQQAQVNQCVNPPNYCHVYMSIKRLKPGNSNVNIWVTAFNTLYSSDWKGTK